MKKRKLTKNQKETQLSTGILKLSYLSGAFNNLLFLPYLHKSGTPHCWDST